MTICVASMPKSGSTYVRSILESMYPKHRLHRPREIRYNLNPTIKDFFVCRRRKTILNQHILPTDENLDVIKSFRVTTVAVLMRNPRDALVSFAHQTEEKAPPRIAYIPRDYRSYSQEKKNRFLITSVYPKFLEFILTWELTHNLSHNFDLKIKPFYYESMLSNKVDFFNTLGVFFNQAPKPPSENALQNRAHVRFRKGEVGEHRTFFTSSEIEQLERLEEMHDSSWLSDLVVDN